MTRIPAHHRLVASVFDRLIEIKDTEEAQPQNPMSLSLAELQSNVFRDLQAMLNTRRALSEALDETSELRQSTVTFGLPDISSVNPESLDHQATIRTAVEDAIRLFEPRLVNVAVQVQEVTQLERSLKFTVRAVLKIEPNPVPVEFDTVIEGGTGAWKVKQGS
jgi:type VI secretion system protein ImpF